MQFMPIPYQYMHQKYKTAQDVPALQMRQGPMMNYGQDLMNGYGVPALSADGQPNNVMQLTPRPPMLMVNQDPNMVDPALTNTPAADPNAATTPAPSSTTPVLLNNSENDPDDNARNNTATGKQTFMERMRTRLNAMESTEGGNIPLSEKLIRMGGAMNASAHLGGNAQLGAMGQEYGAIQNEQRAQQNFLNEQAANRLNLYQESIQEQQDALNSITDQENKMQDALDKFDQFGNSVTGAYDGTMGSWLDSAGLGNAEKAAFRLELKAIVVDNTLLRTANTKGAISDREMALFQSPMPTMYQSEEVWKNWLKARKENLAVIKKRLQNGITVASGSMGFTNQYRASDQPNAGGKGGATGGTPAATTKAASGATSNTSAFSQEELDEIGRNL